MPSTHHAIVIAGGTREPIDDVRVITNLSTGRFGVAIARALKRQGIAVTLAASTGVAESLEDFPAAIRFASYADLSGVIETLVREAGPSSAPIVFMAAAVSDFSPVRSEGKISSDQEEITITLRRNPKLLARFRERFGTKAFLVGFKLTSGLSRESMLEKAAKQLEACRLDLVVANDVKRFADDRHPVTLLAADGEETDVDGDRETVAERVVAEALVLARRAK